MNSGSQAERPNLQSVTCPWISVDHPRGAVGYKPFLWTNLTDRLFVLRCLWTSVENLCAFILHATWAKVWLSTIHSPYYYCSIN